MNITSLTPVPKIQYTTVTYHAISPVEIFVVIISFIIMSYYYINIRKNKELYMEWINPRGHKVNLYILITQLYWIYVAIVIIFGIIQIMWV